MMMITTRSSIRVKPPWLLLLWILLESLSSIFSSLRYEIGGQETLIGRGVESDTPE